MATRSLDNQLQQYWSLLEKEEKQSILTFIKSFLKQKEAPQRLSIEQYNKALEEAEKRMNAGQYTSLEDAIKQSESW